MGKPSLKILSESEMNDCRLVIKTKGLFPTKNNRRRSAKVASELRRGGKAKSKPTPTEKKARLLSATLVEQFRRGAVRVG